MNIACRLKRYGKSFSSSENGYLVLVKEKDRIYFISNLFFGGAAPKDVKELLGHSNVSSAMNSYAHATRKAKRTSARLIDKVVGEG